MLACMQIEVRLYSFSMLAASGNLFIVLACRQLEVRLYSVSL